MHCSRSLHGQMRDLNSCQDTTQKPQVHSCSWHWNRKPKSVETFTGHSNWVNKSISSLQENVSGKKNIIFLELCWTKFMFAGNLNRPILYLWQENITTPGWGHFHYERGKRKPARFIKQGPVKSRPLSVRHGEKEHKQQNYYFICDLSVRGTFSPKTSISSDKTKEEKKSDSAWGYNTQTQNEDL